MTDLRFQPGSIEQLRIDELRPYERNPRTQSDDQVAKLAASLVEFGWTMPILVNDELEVIAGHGRILAARRLGLDAVPVIRLAHLTPEQVRAYRIADNKLALDAGWDEELLVRVLDETHAIETILACVLMNVSHQAATNALVLNSRINSERADASNAIALVKEVAADNATIVFGNDRIETRMIEHPGHQSARNVGGRKVRREVVGPRHGCERLETDHTASLGVLRSARSQQDIHSPSTIRDG